MKPDVELMQECLKDADRLLTEKGPMHVLAAYEHPGIREITKVACELFKARLWVVDKGSEEKIQKELINETVKGKEPVIITEKYLIDNLERELREKGEANGGKD